MSALALRGGGDCSVGVIRLRLELLDRGSVDPDALRFAEHFSKTLPDDGPIDALVLARTVVGAMMTFAHRGRSRSMRGDRELLPKAWVKAACMLLPHPLDMEVESILSRVMLASAERQPYAIGD